MSAVASIRAVRFSTTSEAVRRLGGPSLPWGFTVSLVEERIEFAGTRKPGAV